MAEVSEEKKKVSVAEEVKPSAGVRAKKCLTGFGKFLFNVETHEILGRTLMSWLKIFIFYVIFYLWLAAFFCFMLYIFYTTIDTTKPKYMGDKSILGRDTMDFPGLGFRPQPDQQQNPDSTLIWFNKANASDYQFWSNQLKIFVDEARATNNPLVAEAAKLVVKCSFTKDSMHANDTTACKLDTDNFGPCSETSHFGYTLGEPCVLIKLNRIYGWTPELFGSRNWDKQGERSKEKKAFDLNNYLEKLNTDKHLSKMSPFLKDYIRGRLSSESDKGIQEKIAKSVWISCEGDHPADRENMGKITYYPMPGLPSYYFPFQKQKFYQSPFVMVHFSRVVPGALISITCRAYAGNILPEAISKSGAVHFELMVE